MARLLVMVAALAAVAAAAPHVAGAHATPPTVPCGYECLWPIGSHEIPGSMEVGKSAAIEYTYAWEEAPGNDAVGTQAQRELPPGRHAWPEEWGEPARPGGYAGSAVTLVLPEGVGVDGWERLGLERSEAWTDVYGRTTYRYAGLNAYAEGVSSASIGLVVGAGAAIYPDDEVWIDLGVRGAEWRSPVAYLNRAGDSVSVSAEPAAAAGSGGDPYPLRDLHVLPESAVAPLRAEDLGVGARQALVEFLLKQADSGAPLGESDVPGFAKAQVMGRVDKEAAGKAGEGSLVYAYGRLLAHKRSSGYGVADLFASPAEGVKACVHKRGDGEMTTPLFHNGVPACAMVDGGGFYGIVASRDEPVDSASRADIVPVFYLEGERARALTLQGAKVGIAGMAVEDAGGATASLGKHTVRPNTPDLFRASYFAYADVLEAHRHFKDEVGYDTPLVTIQYGRGAVAGYFPGSSTIELQAGARFMSHSPRGAVLHEYGHHVMNTVYDGGLPFAQNCNPHRIDRASSPTCAWVEGWAHFVQALVDGVPVRAGDDTDDVTVIDYDWETHKMHSVNYGVRDPRVVSPVVQDYYLGEDGEGSVTAILWDIYDGVGEPGDDVEAGIRGVWAAFADAREEDEAYTALSIHDFYDDWNGGGRQNLDGVFTINGVEVTPEFSPPSLRLSVERSGMARAGDYAAYAREGDAIVARLDLGRSAAAGTTPSATLFGGAPTPMSAVGDSRSEWSWRQTVPSGAHNGAASVTIRADGPGLELASGQAVAHTTGSDTVTLSLASVPLNGEYAVTARASIADLDGAALGSDQSRTAEWNPALASIDSATISPDGGELTLVFNKGVEAVSRTGSVSRVGVPGSSILTPGWLHVPGSNTVKLHLADAPLADVTLNRVWLLIPAATTRTWSFENVHWNAEAPALEHVTVSPNGRALTLAFSEKVTLGLGFLRRHVSPASTQEYINVLSDTHTIPLPRALEPGTYMFSDSGGYFDGLGQSSRPATIARAHSYTYNPSGPTFDHVKVSADGRTLTLTFSEGMDRGYVTRDRFVLGGGLALAGESPIEHTDGARTVLLKLASAPASDGTYEVTAKGTIRSSAGVGLGSDQKRSFVWNPEAPAFEHVGVSADGMTLTLTFSEGVSSRGVSLRTIQPSSSLAFESATHRPGSGELAIHLDRAPGPGTHHVRVLRDISDVAGRGMAVDQERAFTWDASPPTFESVEASADGRTLTLTFSEGLDTRTVTTCDVPRIGTSCPLYGPGPVGSAARTVTTGNFELPEGLEFLTADGEDAVRPILHTDGGAQVTIRLASAPPQAGTYTVTAKAGIKDTTNVAMGSDQKRSFSWTPGIPKLESAAFSRDGRAVTLKFSEGLDTSTVTKGSVSIDGGSAALLVTQGAAGAGITVDTEVPRLLDALFTSASEVRLEFSEPLDDTTVTAAAFGVSAAGGDPIGVTPAYVAGERTVTLSLSPAAAAGTAHGVSVRAGLTDRAGNPVPAATVQREPPAAANAAPTFTARTATGGPGGVVVVTFNGDVRLIEGQELDPRDWVLDGSYRPPTHHADLENGVVWLRHGGGAPDTVTFSPPGGLPKIESLAGHDLPVGSMASVPSGRFPSFFADAVSEGRIMISFNLSLFPADFVQGTETISGTTAASEWRVGGVAAAGLSKSALGQAAQSIAVSNARSFYLHHGVTGADGTLQVEYVGPAEESAMLANSDGNALAPIKVTSVDRIRNAIVEAEFLDSRTVRATATKALDARWADRLYVQNDHDSRSSPDMSNPRSAIVRLGFDARDGCQYTLGINRPGISSDIVLGDTRGNGFTYADMHAPVIRSATTNGAATDVTFNEPVSFGASPTLAQHRGHWSVEVGGAAMEIASVAVSEDDASTVTIRHAALPRTDAAPTVKYDGSADDDARVRDTRASQCTDTDAPSKNEQGGMLEVVASDGAAPGAVAVSAAVSRGGGPPKSGPNALWAGIGDTVTVSLAMDEDGREASPPRLIAAGSSAEMARGETARLWSGGVGIAAGAAQGPLGYTITAPDAAGNLGVFVDAEGGEPIARVDTVLPGIATAKTVSAGQVRVELTEGAWGVASAADWTVDGVRATGISTGGGGFAPSVALAGEGALVLAHPGSGGTGETPAVVYVGGGAPGAALDPAPSPDPPPEPPRAGISLDVGALDGAEVRLGESLSFEVTVTVADGGMAIVLLDGEPGFVTVQNAELNRARVTVDASHESAVAGEHEFTVVASTGSDPATRQVTITVL